MSLPEVSDSDSSRSATAPERVDTILIVEDEPFIAMDMDDILKGAGFTSEIKPSRGEALAWLNDEQPIAAILDLHLRDGDSSAIATVLRARGVPVVVCSGGHPVDLPDDFKGSVWPPKPFVDGQLVDAVKRAIEIHCADMENRA